MTKKIWIAAFFGVLFTTQIFGQVDSTSELKVRNNAISFNFFGTTPLLGITYERVIGQKISLEAGVGALSGGLGVKVFPWNIRTHKLMFHTGFTVTYLSLGNGEFGGQFFIGYFPLGISWFGKRGFNFGFDVGPAVARERFNAQFIPWGNIKTGYRF